MVVHSLPAPSQYDICVRHERGVDAPHLQMSGGSGRGDEGGGRAHCENLTATGTYTELWCAGGKESTSPNKKG